MPKETIVHVITSFSGIGGAEIMLSRLIKQTTNECNHVIISLMEVSEHYQDILAQCDSYHTLHWNGLNTVFVIAKLRALLKKINPITIQCWMYHANVLSSLSLLGKRNKPKVFWGIHHSLASIKEESISVKIGLLLSKYLASKPTGIIYCAKSSLLVF